jgi:hypothetical protein
LEVAESDVQDSAFVVGKNIRSISVVTSNDDDVDDDDDNNNKIIIIIIIRQYKYRAC